MGYYCTVPQCTSLAGKTKNVKFHRFPRDQTMADKWNDILKRGKPYTKYSKVCSLHFTQADYNVTTMGQWKTLSKDALPSQNLPKLNPDGTVMVIRKSRSVKYRETKKEDISDNSDKWQMNTPAHVQQTILQEANLACSERHDQTLAYRLQTLNTIANNISPQHHQTRAVTMSPQDHVTLLPKPEKQDAIMQTDPVQSEEDDTQPNNSYSETSDKSYTEIDYPIQQQNYQKGDFEDQKKYEAKDYTKCPDDYTKCPEDYTKCPDDYTKCPDDYTKCPDDYTKCPDDYAKCSDDYAKCSDDYIPQTNEEYNKEAEKYALERKTHYDKLEYQKGLDNGYQKIPEVYTNFDKYQRQDFNYANSNNYDSVEMLRNQQHNLQILQEQHRITENQNFFNENQIKQEIDINLEDDKYLYDRTKEQMDTGAMYGESQRRLIQQQRLLEQIQQQVKQEPEITNGCENVLQAQSSPYYPPNGHNVTGTYYEQLSRPGPELLIAKQNALAAHTQLWQNTMKRPFFYSESPHYNGTQLLHRYEDLTRILQ